MVEECLELGATGAEIVNTESIRIKQEFRTPCEQNQCGHYGQNWMCPPGVGSLEECEKKVRRFSKGLLFQRVYPLKDSYDIEGMQEAHKNFNSLIQEIRDSVPKNNQIGKYMILGAGACPVCKKCTYLGGEECVFPNKAIASVEAHGIDVKKLLEDHGMSYVNGANTVSYVGLLLYAE
jgi:predicted metal-binding protein